MCILSQLPLFKYLKISSQILFSLWAETEDLAAGKRAASLISQSESLKSDTSFSCYIFHLKLFWKHFKQPSRRSFLERKSVPSAPVAVLIPLCMQTLYVEDGLSFLLAFISWASSGHLRRLKLMRLSNLPESLSPVIPQTDWKSVNTVLQFSSPVQRSKEILKMAIKLWLEGKRTQLFFSHSSLKAIYSDCGHLWLFLFIVYLYLLFYIQCKVCSSFLCI